MLQAVKLKLLFDLIETKMRKRSSSDPGYYWPSMKEILLSLGIISQDVRSIKVKCYDFGSKAVIINN
jgi:hypothetical protein